MWFSMLLVLSLFLIVFDAPLGNVSVISVKRCSYRIMVMFVQHWFGVCAFRPENRVPSLVMGDTTACMVPFTTHEPKTYRLCIVNMVNVVEEQKLSLFFHVPK